MFRLAPCRFERKMWITTLVSFTNIICFIVHYPLLKFGQTFMTHPVSLTKIFNQYILIFNEYFITMKPTEDFSNKYVHIIKKCKGFNMKLHSTKVITLEQMDNIFFQYKVDL